MRIRDSGNYFYFSFDRSDYRRMDSESISLFLDELRKAVPTESRHYYEDQNEWQIAAEYRSVFDGLMGGLLNKDQLSLF